MSDESPSTGFVALDSMLFRNASSVFLVTTHLSQLRRSSESVVCFDKHLLQSLRFTCPIRSWGKPTLYLFSRYIHAGSGSFENAAR